jgi:hypothetical protein
MWRKLTIDDFRNHADKCPTCKNSDFGLCAIGFSILGQATGMRPNDGQLELDLQEQLDRPLVRAWMREHDRQLSHAAEKANRPF